MAAVLRRVSRRSLLEFSSISNVLLTPSGFGSSSRSIVSKLFVGGLSYYTSENNLAEAFGQFGQVVDAKIVTERGTERSKGFGFVTYACQDEAQNAIEQMDGKELNGRVIHVDIAKPKQGIERDTFPIARGPPDAHSAANHQN